MLMDVCEPWTFWAQGSVCDRLIGLGRVGKIRLAEVYRLAEVWWGIGATMSHIQDSLKNLKSQLDSDNDNVGQSVDIKILANLKINKSKWQKCWEPSEDNDDVVGVDDTLLIWVSESDDQEWWPGVMTRSDDQEWWPELL